MLDNNTYYHLLCDQRLRQNIRSNLKHFAVQPHDRTNAKQAAVAITIVNAGHGAGIFNLPAFETPQEDAALILTRRSSRMKNHAGQWAFPGGHMERGEKPEDAALRELHEEVDLKLPPTSVLGRLDDFTTRSGFVITPVVVWGGNGANFAWNMAVPPSLDSGVETFGQNGDKQENAILLDLIADYNLDASVSVIDNANIDFAGNLWG